MKGFCGESFEDDMYDHKLPHGDDLSGYEIKKILARMEASKKYANKIEQTAEPESEQRTIDRITSQIIVFIHCNLLGKSETLTNLTTVFGRIAEAGIDNPDNIHLDMATVITEIISHISSEKFKNNDTSKVTTETVDALIRQSVKVFFATHPNILPYIITALQSL